MFKFSFYGWALIALITLILILISYFFIKRIKNKSLKNKISNFERIGYLDFILGFVITIISIVLYVLIQMDIAKTNSFFRPVSEMTSEPIKLLIVVLFLAGTAILIIGRYYIRFSKKR